jgi:hypothetical protein
MLAAMSDYNVPYVPGHSSAPVSPPAAAQPGYPPARTTTTYPVVGAAVDLAHELGAVRKLQMATMSLAGLAFLCALFAAVFSGFVAYELWRFLGALQKAFGD